MMTMASRIASAIGVCFAPAGFFVSGLSADVLGRALDNNYQSGHALVLFVAILGGLFAGWLAYRVAGALMTGRWLRVSDRMAEGLRRVGNVVGVVFGAPLGVLAYWLVVDETWVWGVEHFFFVPAAASSGFLIVLAIVRGAFWSLDGFRDRE